jgi:hypothetical protein
LLSRAAAQGILYAHQLPDTLSDNAPHRSYPAAALLNGHSRELPAARRPAAVVPEDANLDAGQREAVARALHTPDVCLIAGVAGSGKSRVVAEILCQAAARGERVLFLAPGAAALDHVLAALARRETVCPVRCLAPEETAERLSAEIRGMLLDSRVRHFREHTVPEARAAAAAARQRLDDLQRDEATLQRLDRLAADRAAVAARLTDLDRRQAALFEAVTAETREPNGANLPLAGELAVAKRERDEAITRLDARDSVVRAEQEKTRATLEAVRTDEAKLQPLLEARIGFRFWSGAWWRAFQQSNLRDRLEELHSRRTNLEADAAARAAEAEVAAHERADAEGSFRAVLSRVVGAEIARRSAGLECDRADAAAELARLAAEWDAVAAPLEPAARDAASQQDDAERRSARAKRLAEAEESLAVAERWASAAEEALPELPSQLAASADIVAAATAVIDGDPLFGESAASFDLLVLEEADRITETEFLRASRRARRWVVVGETTTDGAARSPGRALRPAALRAGFFQRLWENLHADPSRLPYSWHRLNDGRLCCQLRPVVLEDRPRLEKECVADRPDVELHIVTPPRGVPELVEVVFPAGLSAADAKTYLFNELQELPVQSRGRGLRWCEEPDRLVLWLDSADYAALERVAIADGVSELIGPTRPQGAGEAPPFLTYALAFDRDAGWTRERAEQWVAHHADLRDSGRTAYLGLPHRMRPALARFVTRLLAAGWGADSLPAVPPPAEDETAVEFVPIPSLLPESDSRRRTESDSRRRAGGTATAPRLRAVKGGAGLETELGESPRPDSLPADLRDALPARGLVNYLEARAVVHELEAMVSDSCFRQEVERWQQSECGRHGQGPAIAVIALYPAQAELIRQLISRVPALVACPLGVEVGTPEQFQQRECLAALVSLTRSHSHRPVSFGEGPHALALAFTRARARLLLFGDPGTLARRGQCAEPVDHLDPAAAAREHGLVAHLVACIQGQGDHAAAFRLRQGTGS